MDTSDSLPGFLQSNKPVLFPSHAALTMSNSDFNLFVANELRGLATTGAQNNGEDSETIRSNPFIDGLHKHKEQELAEKIGPDPYNKMLTQNADLAYKSSNDRLVDLFYELEGSITGDRLAKVLADAWIVDPLTSLKIIFNARSIHLGKSSRKTFYRAAGWLAKNHPHTLIANLQWLYRPLIEKKVRRSKDSEDDDIVLVGAEADEDDPTKYDVNHGVSHGYWKDLLNMLAIAANNKFDGLADPSEVLNTENRRVKTDAMHKRARKRGDKVAKLSKGIRKLHTSKHTSHPNAAEYNRKMQRQARNSAAIAVFKTDPVYRTLHLAIARLFAEQLDKDILTLRNGDAKAKKNISLCGKWAPSEDRFHDKHTFILSTIAELMHPRDALDGKNVSGGHILQPTDNREIYLRYAREMYRRDVSDIRKHLQIVERDITAKTYDRIDYSKVPSLAMSRYKDLFINRDNSHFMEYLKNVALGKASISGATLLPSALIKDMRQASGPFIRGATHQSSVSPSDLIKREVLNLQWKTLVQRIKDSGSMSSAIAVCDVSGSMSCQISNDGTQAMDASIGLSLLVAEVTNAAFGGSLITFDTSPEVFKVDLNQSLAEKYQWIKEAPWGGSTDFVAVFTKLILPMAIRNNLKQEDMVKRVFVFSDMQFNSAGGGSSNRWATSYERIKAEFETAGYEMPELVFWNLCGERGNTGFGPSYKKTDASAKPVTASDVGTMLVSGYSQGMLKSFMDGESLEEEDSDDAEDSDTVVVGGAKKKPDSLSLVKKVTGHKAYDMLKVYD